MRQSPDALEGANEQVSSFAEKIEELEAWWMKFKGKIVILGYFILSHGMNELECYLFLMNWNPVYKWNLIYIGIIFYFIPIFIKVIQNMGMGREWMKCSFPLPILAYQTSPN